MARVTSVCAWVMTMLGVAVLAGASSLAGGGAADVDLPAGARVAVVALNSNGGSQVDRVVSDMLTTALRRNGLRVLERQELEAVLKEQRLATGGHVDPSTAVETGRLTGAQYLLGAKATEFGVRDARQGGLFGLGPFAGIQVRTSTARVVLDARLIDVRSGEVLGTASGEGKVVNYGGTLFGGSWAGGAISLGGIDIGSKEWSESLLGKASRKAVDTVLQKLMGARYGSDGRVLAVNQDGMCVVSLGSRDGIRTGDRLDVLTVHAIRDSSGEAVWTEEQREGSLTVVEVRADRCKAEAAGDTRVSEGDLVRKPEGRASDRRRTR